MKKDIHPESREVLFHDTSVDQYFLIRSTLKTTQTKKWEDGKTYPYCVVDTSSASHPFYTGQQKILDTGGRVQRFEKKFGKKSGQISYQIFSQIFEPFHQYQGSFVDQYRMDEMLMRYLQRNKDMFYHLPIFSFE